MGGRAAAAGPAARRRPLSPPSPRRPGDGPDGGSRWGVRAAVAWLVAVALVALSRAVLGYPHAHALASTPAGVAGGRLWPLLTSGLVVAGAPAVQIPAAALVVALTVRSIGARGFWIAAVAGHIGATLLVYVGVGAVWLLSPGSADAVLDQPDYGISAVWAAALGALAAGAVRRHGRLGLLLAAGCLILLAGTIPFAPSIAGAEHVVAYVLGMATTAWWLRRRLSRSPAAAAPPAAR